MSSAGNNEHLFKQLVEEKLGKVFGGKRIWRDNDADVEISVDQTIETDDFELLIEVDSGNYAKLIVGQYALLNELCESSGKRNLFIVVHFYKRGTDKAYNPDRTSKNLRYINQNIYDNNGLSFLVFNFSTFFEFIDDITDINELNDKIKKCVA